MAEIYIDSTMTDAERCEALYRGAIFVYRPTDIAREFCAFADKLISEAFGGMDPETAQYELPVERYIEILQQLKPHFIHHPESKRFVTEILSERGCDPSDTYFDVPRMRSSTSDGYLISGIAYAWHPHRDTWYSAPSCQINWWSPIYPITARNGMSFYLEFFDKVVPNDSSQYDYEVWNAKHRFSAASQVKKDTRPLPGPKNPIAGDKATTLVCEVGGLIVFSGAHLHASVPNDSGKTRFSIDFRTVDLDDCRNRIGAPTQDVECTGSSIRDFKRARDLEEMPDDLAAVFTSKS